MVHNLQLRLGEQFGLKPRSGWEQRIAVALRERGKVRGANLASDSQEPFSSANELRELAGRLTVEESYFYRHQAHFDHVLQHIAHGARAAQPVRIWSAGCAGGEEPYTLAIVLQERLGKSAAENVRILASDVNNEAIERARAGIFRRWSFRSTADSTRNRYFRPIGKGGAYDLGEMQLCEELRSRVRFSHLSIQEHLSLLPAGSLDAILFRNVAVYLDHAAVGRIYNGFANVLRPGGIVLVSASDQRPQSPRFESGLEGNGTVYTLVRNDAASPRLAEPPTPRPTHSPSAARPISAVARIPEPDISALVHKAQQLADRGQYAGALSLCNEMVRASGPHATAYQLRGQVCFHQRRYGAAVADLRHACELASGDDVARFWYALALQAHGQVSEAQLQCRSVLHGLSGKGDDTLLNDGQSTVGELASAAEALRRTLE